MDDRVVPQNRRAFLGRLGKTIAVGLGFGLMTGHNALAKADVCGIWCTDTGSQGSCPSGQNSYHCISSPCGYDYWTCEAPHGNYCACNGCC
jgi:hypothetical protein